MDLAVTTILLIYAAVVLFRLGRRYSHRFPATAPWLSMLVMAVSIYLCWTASYSLRWAELIPHGCSLILTNAPLALIAVAAGLLMSQKDMSATRKAVLAGSMLFAATAVTASVLLQPLLQPIDLSPHDRWQDGVCLQSHEASCAPAAAATLVSRFGIVSTEREMALDCLTSGGGTLSLAAFRGVSHSIRNEKFAARALVCDPYSRSCESLQQRLPLLAMVSFVGQLQDSLVDPNPRVAEPSLAGFLPAFAGPLPQMPIHNREQHAVVLLGRHPDGDWEVADPAVGRVRWTDEYFRSVWVGEGIYLVNR